MEDKQLTLMELNDLLEEAVKTFPEGYVVKNGFGEPGSYRGYYEQIAFEPEQNVLLEKMLEEVMTSIGYSFEGYKGGTFLMGHATPVNISNWGVCQGEEDILTQGRLFQMLAVEGQLPKKSEEDVKSENERLKQHILAIVSDLVTDFLYYDRKEDEEVGPEVIEQAVANGVITADEIVERFRDELGGI